MTLRKKPWRICYPCQIGWRVHWHTPTVKTCSRCGHPTVPEHVRLVPPSDDNDKWARFSRRALRGHARRARQATRNTKR